MSRTKWEAMAEALEADMDFVDGPDDVPVGDVATVGDLLHACSVYAAAQAARERP